MSTLHCSTPEHMACTTVAVELHLTEPFLRDVFTTAIEGGVNYWARVTEYRWTETDPANVYAVLVETEVYDQEPQTHRVTLANVAKGISIILGQPQLRPGLVGNIMALDAGEIDSDDADVILQLGLLGEVTYG
jgi:hypothetical protein